MYQNKEKTLQVLLDSGLELFGKYGYDSVTIRQISEYTGLNSSLISYYFGGKQQYYLAVIVYVTDILIAHFSPVEWEKLQHSSIEELEVTITNIVTEFFAWFTSDNGINGTQIFFYEIVSQRFPEVQEHFGRAVDFITPHFIELLTIYYTKTERQHVNPVFVWILLISVTQNMSLHSNAPEEARQAFKAANLAENMINLIINMR